MQVYNGLIPPVLVPLARGALRPYGIEHAISDSGEVDAATLLALAYETVEIRTNLTEPVKINLKEPSAGHASALMKDLQPAIIFRGRAGEVTFAPAGMPTGGGRASQAKIIGGLGIGAALIGLFALGAVLVQR